MRKFLTTVATAAVLTIGSLSAATAAPPVSGNDIIDAVLADFYEAVTAACTPQGGVAPSASACEAALLEFAALTTPEALAAVPAIQAAIASGALTPAAIQTAVTSETFVQTFLAANTTLNADIVEANAGNTAFLTAINEVTTQTLGAGTAAGGAGGAPEASPTAL